MYVGVCVYLYMYVCGYSVCVCMHVWVLSMYLYLFVCVGCVLQHFGFIQWDPNPASGDPDPIQIRARCGPDTMAIRRPTHGMIRRSVPVRAVKIRRRFGSETASFQVSVCFYLNSLFPVVYMYVCLTLIISCDFLLYFTSVITCICSWDVYDCLL